MSGWSDLYSFTSKSLPKQTFLCVGEISSLVLDVVHSALDGYSAHISVSSPEDLSYPVSSSGTSSAYLVSEPSMEVLQALDTVVRGSTDDSVFILMKEAPEDSPAYEYLKRRAQANKMYFTVSSPKSDTARRNMTYFFQRRWGASTDLVSRVCASFNFSPGELYYFDQMFRMVADGNMLSSSEASAVVSSLLGKDSKNTVVTSILLGEEVNGEYDDDFTRIVLTYILDLLLDAKVIHGAWDTGSSTVTEVSRVVTLPKFKILQAWPLAERLSAETIGYKEQIIMKMLKNYKGNPETLSITAQVW